MQGPNSIKGTVSESTPQNLKPDFYFRTPIEAHIVKKNNRPILGRGQKKFIGKSPRLRNAEQWLTLALKSHANKIGLHAPLRGDLHIILRFYFKHYFTKDHKRSRTLPDLSNLLELPADCLQTAGIIKNDTDIVSFNNSGRFQGDQNELEIEIYVIRGGYYGYWPKNAP